MSRSTTDTYAYQIITLGPKTNTVDLQAQLNTLGGDGWQVVAIDQQHGRILLKQQLTT